MTDCPIIVTRRCEDCGFMRKSKRRRPCPKCSGWMLSLRDADAAAIEANPIVQATTLTDYIAAVRIAQGTEPQ